MISALIFDLDGTLVDSEPAHYQALVDVLRPFKVSFGVEHYLARYLGLDDQRALERVEEDFRLHFEPGQVKALVEEKSERFRNQHKALVRLQPGTREFLEKVPRSIRCAICSAALRADIRAVLPPDIFSRFEVVVAAEDVSRSKPDPEGYLLALRELRVASKEALVFEDTPHGIAAAKGAGIQVWALTHTCAPSLLAQADRVITGFAALGGTAEALFASGLS